MEPLKSYPFFLRATRVLPLALAPFAMAAIQGSGGPAPILVEPPPPQHPKAKVTPWPAAVLEPQPGHLHGEGPSWSAFSRQPLRAAEKAPRPRPASSLFHLTIVNASNEELHRLYLSPEPRSMWGPNRLDLGVLPVDGELSLFGFSPGSWEIFVVDASGHYKKGRMHLAGNHGFKVFVNEWDWSTERDYSDVEWKKGHLQEFQSNYWVHDYRSRSWWTMNKRYGNSGT